MFEFLEGWSPVEQALAAGLFTWGMTAAGAGLVFFFKEVSNLLKFAFTFFLKANHVNRG